MSILGSTKKELDEISLINREFGRFTVNDVRDHTAYLSWKRQTEITPSIAKLFHSCGIKSVCLPEFDVKSEKMTNWYGLKFICEKTSVSAPIKNATIKTSSMIIDRPLDEFENVSLTTLGLCLKKSTDFSKLKIDLNIETLHYIQPIDRSDKAPTTEEIYKFFRLDDDMWKKKPMIYMNAFSLWCIPAENAIIPNAKDPFEGDYKGYVIERF